MRTKSLKFFKLSRLICLVLMLLFAAIGLIAQNTNPPTNESVKVEITGELKKWHKITLTFNGPETSEMAFKAVKFKFYISHHRSRKKTG